MSCDSGDGLLPSQKKIFQRSQERAFICLNEKEYPRAFAHFLVAFTIHPDVADSLMNVFLQTLDKVAADCESQQNWDELFMCYQRSLEILPHSAHILHGLASVLFRLGHIESAIGYFQKAYKENPFFTPSLYCIDNIKNALIERWHFVMINDNERNSAYKTAIQKAIKDGRGTVLDIGAGTGILSMIASDAQAEEVYACEGNVVMFRILENVVKANSKDIKLLQKFSYDINIPEDISEKVSLVVTEIFDAGLLGENVLRTLKHAWEHLIVTKTETSESVGTVIPRSATLWAVPIECDDFRNSFMLNQNICELFDIKKPIASKANSEEPYTTEKLKDYQQKSKFLGSSKPFLTINFCDLDDITSCLNGKSVLSTFEVILSGRLDAIAVWFELNLDDTIKICTGLENSASCWEQSIFYVLPFHLQGYSPYVTSGQKIEATFKCKNHLTLERVVTISKSDSEERASFIDAYAIQSLNSYFENKVLNLNLYAKSRPEDRPVVDISKSVIDISSFPSLGLKSLLDGAQKLIVLPSQHLCAMYELQTLSGLSRDKIRSLSYEDLCSQNFPCSMVICEPVEPCGLLRKNILEDIALLRTLNRNEPPLIFPNKISIFVELIQSDELASRVRIISDENCLSYKVSEFLNPYQSIIQQDLHLCKLNHDKLSRVIRLCEIDFSQLILEKSKLQSFIEFHGTEKVNILKSGHITALPFWFELSYDKDCFLDTSSAGMFWGQAAIIPESDIDVCEGDEVILDWSCRNSCLNIIVKKQ